MSQVRSVAYACSRILACAALVVVADAVLPDAARASCGSPRPRVIWSSPAQDETEVPLDADLLVVTEGVGTGAPATLDGEPLEASTLVPGLYDLGTLEPQTTYEVAIAARDPVTGRPGELRWTFTTGDAAADEDGPDAVDILNAHGREIAPGEPLACRDALFADTCFDTGDPTLESFDTDIEAELWVVESIKRDAPSTFTLYPGECGQPRMLDYGGPRAVGMRYRVHAIQRDGSLASSDTIDGPLGEDGGGPQQQPGGDDGVPQRKKDASICAATDPGRSSDAGAAVALVTLVFVASRSSRRRSLWR